MGYRYSRYSYNRLRNQQTTHSYSQVQESELIDPNLLTHIQNIRTQNGLSDWEKNFLESIEGFFQRNNRLSSGQYLAFKKIQNKYTDAAIAARDQFAKDFTDEKRNDMRIVAQIYNAFSSRYHSYIYKKVLEDANFVPSKEQWTTFMENKYSLGYLENVKSTPKFNVGDTVAPSSLDKTKQYQMAIIIDTNVNLPMTHASGGKRYSILPYGSSTTIEVEERYMKKAPKI